MTNDSSTRCVLNSIDIDKLIWKVGAFCFPIAGIPGHLIIIITIILNSKRKCFHPTYSYFIFISITELTYLVFLFWDWLAVINFVTDPRRILNCAFFYPFVSGTGFISLLLLAQLNLDRISIIYQPERTHSYFTHKRILIKITVTHCSLIIFILHYYFSLYYDSNAFIIFGQSCRVYSYAQQWFYSFWPYIHILARLTPCMISIFCTIYIFHNRCYKNVHRKTFFHRQQQTFSLILVIYSIYTFVAILPINVLQIMWKYELNSCCLSHCSKTDPQVKQWKIFNTICIMCEASIYTLKFYLKFLFSSEFRNDVKQLTFVRSKSEKINNKRNRISLE
ncbi:hypothetical protein I4U23_024618 [Adineta vaga]|nr:hypothetical protein I4U23_024618 [Adineta vaga]